MVNLLSKKVEHFCAELDSPVAVLPACRDHLLRCTMDSIITMEKSLSSGFCALHKKLFHIDFKAICLKICGAAMRCVAFFAAHDPAPRPAE